MSTTFKALLEEEIKETEIAVPYNKATLHIFRAWLSGLPFGDVTIEQLLQVFQFAEQYIIDMLVSDVKYYLFEKIKSHHVETINQILVHYNRTKIGKDIYNEAIAAVVNYKRSIHEMMLPCCSKDYKSYRCCERARNSFSYACSDRTNCCTHRYEDPTKDILASLNQNYLGMVNNIPLQVYIDIDLHDTK